MVSEAKKVTERAEKASGRAVEKTPERTSRTGGRNLAIMAFAAILISSVLTAVSLMVYHYSGDIYLDRSRPGYLPNTDEMEAEEETEEGEYDFEKGGAITKEVLEEYLKKLSVEVKALDDYQNPFDEESLSNAHFGLDAE